MIPTILLTAYLLCASCQPVFFNTNIQDMDSVRKEDQFILDFNRINLNSISVKSEAELPDSLEESGWCLEIANIPEAKLEIYGYVSDDFGFRGILIDMADELYHFPDIYFSSPQLQLPKAYWDEKEELLILSCHNMTGTSLSADELIVIPLNDKNHVQAYSFSQKDLEDQLKKQLLYEYDDGGDSIKLYDNNGNLLGVQNTANLEGRNITGLNVLNFVSFTPGEETIVSVTVGLEVSGWMTPYYDTTSLTLKAPVQIKLSNTYAEFEIGDLACCEENAL